MEMCAKRQLKFWDEEMTQVTVYQIQWWYSQNLGIETHAVRIWTWEPDKKRAIGESGRFKASGCFHKQPFLKWFIQKKRIW